MKALVLVVVATVIYATVAFPQIKEGQAFSNEAINQAINTQLIPKNAQISAVVESQEAAVIESISANQRVDLSRILTEVPDEVIDQLHGMLSKIES